jgi:hypothetical protein
MDFEALVAELNNKPSFQVLSQDAKDKLNAVLFTYRDEQFNLSKQLQEQLAELKRKQEREQKRKEGWGTVLSVGTGGVFSLVKGVIEWAVDGISGVISLGTGLLQNVYEVFRHEGRFGDGFVGWTAELERDIINIFLEPGEQFASSMMSVGAGVVDLVAGWFGYDISKEAEDWAKQKRDELAIGRYNWLYEEDFWGPGFMGSFDPKKDWQKTPQHIQTPPSVEEAEKGLDDRVWQWRKDFDLAKANATKWIKQNVTGVLDDTVLMSEDTWVSRNLNSMSYQIGRLVPNIVASMYGVPSSVTSFAFFSSVFGQSYDEALNRGSSIDDAMSYALTNAFIESGLEDFGGMKTSGEIPFDKSQPFWKELLKKSFKEGMEEFMAEVFSGGVESVLTDKIDNSYFWDRALESFASGAVIGGVLGGTLGPVQQKQREKYQKMFDDFDKFFKDREDGKGGKDGSDGSVEAQADAIIQEFAKEYKPDWQLLEEFNDFIDEVYAGNATADVIGAELGVRIDKAVKNFNEEYQKIKEDKEGKTTFTGIPMNDLSRLFIDFDSEKEVFHRNFYADVILENPKEFQKGYREVKRQSTGDYDLEPLRSTYAISEKRTPGIVHARDVKFLTMKEIESFCPEDTVAFIKQVLKEEPNVAFIDAKRASLNGHYTHDTGFIYINVIDHKINNTVYAKDLKDIASTLQHEKTHYVQFASKEAWDKVNALFDEGIETKLKDIKTPLGLSKYYLFRNDYGNGYLEKSIINKLYGFLPYSSVKTFGAEIKKDQTFIDAVKRYNERIEKIAFYIGTVASDPTTIEKMYNVSPEFVQALNDVVKDIPEHESELKETREKFAEYVEKAKELQKKNIYVNFENREKHKEKAKKSGYINVGGKLMMAPAGKAIFFNTDSRYDYDAHINEVHTQYIYGDFEANRMYSEQSLKALEDFYNLFNAYKNGIYDNVNDIIDNLLLSYEEFDEASYKETIGTKYPFLWYLISENKNSEFVNNLKTEAEKRIQNIIDENRDVFVPVEGEENLFRVTDAGVFRDITALRMITINPFIAQNTLLFQKSFYENAELYMYKDAFGEVGGGGFAILPPGMYLWRPVKKGLITSFFDTLNNKAQTDYSLFLQDKIDYYESNYTKYYDLSVDFLERTTFDHYKKLGLVFESVSYPKTLFLREWSNSFSNWFKYADIKNLSISYSDNSVLSQQIDNLSFQELKDFAQLKYQKQAEIEVEKLEKPNVKFDTYNTVSSEKTLQNMTLMHNYIKQEFNSQDYKNEISRRMSFNRKITPNKLSHPRAWTLIKKLRELRNVLRVPGKLYNHIYDNTIQEVIKQIAINTNEHGIKDSQSFVKDMMTSILNDITFLDTEMINSESAKLDPNNPKGIQYQGKFYDALRNKDVVFDLAPLFNIIDTVLELDFAIDDVNEVGDYRRIAPYFKSGGKIANTLFNATNIEKQSSLGITNKKIDTFENVLKQNYKHIQFLQDLAGRNYRDGKNNIKKVGLLGNFKLFLPTDVHALDLYAFSNLFGMFTEHSLGNVLQERITKAQEKNLIVWNAYYKWFEEFLDKNHKKLYETEKTFYNIENLKNAKGEPLRLPASQVIELRMALFREITRNKLIDMEIRDGEKSKHFIDGGEIGILGNVKNRQKAEKMKQRGKVISQVELFNELNAIIEKDAFLKEFMDLTYRYFDEGLYEFENKTLKDTVGLPLHNDNHLLATLDLDTRKELFDGLNVDYKTVKHIYTPFRTEMSSKSNTTGAFNMKNVMDFGIDDGMVKGITETTYPLLLSSINNLITHQTRAVANYYSYYRVMLELNEMFNEPIKVKTKEGKEFSTNLEEQVKQISPDIVPFYEKLLRDMAGYGMDTDLTTKSMNRLMSILTRHFYRASLGFNLKVAATQFASLFTLATVYEDKPTFMAKMFKNFFDPKNKEKAKFYTENSQFYMDRARNSIHDVGVATSSDFNKSKWTRFWEMSMNPINSTDARINRSLYNTLVEMGYSKEKAMELTDKGIREYQSSALHLAKPQLLRTDNQILKLYTRFLGEQMKTISNLADSRNHLRIIEAFEKNYDGIKAFYENEIKTQEEFILKLEEDKSKLETELGLAQNEQQRKELNNQIKAIEKQIESENANLIETQEMTSLLLSDIDNEIKSKPEAKKLLARRIAIFTQQVSWIAIVGTIFSLIRGGARDKDEEETFAMYLAKLYGEELFAEIVQMFPFVRDAYGLFTKGYNIDDIDILAPVSNLGIAFRNMIIDATNQDGKFDYLKHIRRIATHLGGLLGVPVRQIERLFTTPTNWVLKDWNYAYRDATGQQVAPNKELANAIKNNNMKLAETIIERQLRKKNISYTDATYKEIERLKKQGVNVNPSSVPYKFTIDDIEYINDRDKFSNTYDKASFVVERLLKSPRYKRLSLESKGKLINAVYNYYHRLAKQEVSGEQLISKDRVYNLNQAYNYFNGRTSYYYKQDKKTKKED